MNADQKGVIVKKVCAHFGNDLKGKTFGVWGLAFKPDTDDMRESPAVTIIKDLIDRGAKIHAYDPKAVEEAKACYLKDVEGITYYESKYEAIDGVDGLILITEWKEFRSPDFFEIKRLLRTPVIFDGRNQYEKRVVNKYGLDYYQIGVRGDKK